MSLIANISLVLWPLIVFILFRRLRFEEAAFCSVLAGYLLLPNKFGLNLPLLPLLDKFSIPAIAAIFAAMIALRQNAPSSTLPSGNFIVRNTTVLKGWVPQSKLVQLGLIILIIGAFGTMLTNRAPVVFGPTVLKPLRPYDAFNITLAMFTALLPFFLARKFLAHPEAHRRMLAILVIAGLAYSLLALIEVRISPQLHRMLYGVHPHSWVQTMRGGGFRPTVFLNHGLLVGLFFAMTIVAAVAYVRCGEASVFWKRMAIVGWLCLTLVLVKSLGALAITMLIAPLVLFLNKRLLLLAAGVIIVLFLCYPALRTSGLVPLDQIIAGFAKIDQARANSLGARLGNEDLLLSRFADKPIFGWGGWGRGRFYDEFGRDLTIIDGAWINDLNQTGWVGYLAKYGLMTGAVLILAFARRSDEIDMATVGLCMVLAANIIDLVPNGGITPITWLISGALFGRLELSAADIAQEEDEVQNTGPPRRSVYARARHTHVRVRPESVEQPRTKARYARPKSGQKRND